MHHFFPKKVLKSSSIDDSKINLFANIVVLNEKANRTFKSKEPKEYLSKHKVETQRLTEQLIPTDENFLQVSQYEEFLQKRASDLAEDANRFIGELKNS